MASLQGKVAGHPIVQQLHSIIDKPGTRPGLSSKGRQHWLVALWCPEPYLSAACQLALRHTPQTVYSAVPPRVMSVGSRT